MNARSVRCPWCNAERNNSCRTSDGRQLRVAHRARVRVARAVARMTTPAPAARACPDDPADVPGEVSE